MIVNCIRDGKARSLGQARIELLHPRVQTSNNALQFGKLFHQFRREVGLSQASRLVNYSGTHDDATLLQLFIQPTAQALHTLCLVVITTQILLKGHVLQRFEPLQQRLLLICLPEKSGIVEARP